MDKARDIIFLQTEEDEITWCNDRINKSDVIYIRLDSKAFAAAMNCPECLAALGGFAEPADVLGMYGTVHFSGDGSRSFVECASVDVWEAPEPPCSS